MAIRTNGITPAMLPFKTAEYITLPLFDEAVALRTAGIEVVEEGTRGVRIPRVTQDVNAAVVAEGAEFTPSDIETDELEVVPVKIGALTVLSSESIEDTDPTAANLVGESISRQLGRNLDTGVFGSLNGFTGLNALTGFTAVNVTATNWAKSTDPFIEAVYKAKGFGADILSFVAHPDTALEFALMKESGSNRNLIQPEATADGIVRTIAGVPILESTAVPVGTIYGYDPRYVRVVMRQDIKIEESPHPKFSSDEVLIRGKLRAGLAVIDPRTVVKIKKGSS